MLYFGPLSQCAQEIDCWSIIEAPFALFQEEMKVRFLDAIVASEMAFRLVPEVLDAISVISVDRKNFRVVDAMVMEL